jgi:hypothetical protein
MAGLDPAIQNEVRGRGAVFSRGAVRPVGESGDQSVGQNAADGSTGAFYEGRLPRGRRQATSVAAVYGKYWRVNATPKTRKKREIPEKNESEQKTHDKNTIKHDQKSMVGSN